MPAWIVSVLFASALTLAGCAVGGSTQVATGDIIDGFEVGVQVACGGGIGPAPSDGWCPGLDQTKAIAALDFRDPGHAAITSVMTFTDGTQPEPVDVTGNAPIPTPGPSAHAGPLVTVFVFVLADGSTKATGVACPASLMHGVVIAADGSCVGVGSYP